MHSTDEQLKKKLGQQIKMYRQKKNMSHEKLAEKANLDANNIGRIERGERAPTSITLFKLIYALDIYPQSEFLAEVVEVLHDEES